MIGGLLVRTKTNLLYIAIILFSVSLLFAACGVESSVDSALQAEDTSSNPPSQESPPSQEASNTATLSWEAPATNADGTPLDDLSGYKVYYGKTSGVYGEIMDVSLTDTPNFPEYTLTALESGTRYYFAVTAYDTSGNESNFSEEVYKDIP